MDLFVFLVDTLSFSLLENLLQFLVWEIFENMDHKVFDAGG
jgi:hypothetical protein